MIEAWLLAAHEASLERRDATGWVAKAQVPFKVTAPYPLEPGLQQQYPTLRATARVYEAFVPDTSVDVAAGDRIVYDDGRRFIVSVAEKFEDVLPHIHLVLEERD